MASSAFNRIWLVKTNLLSIKPKNLIIKFSFIQITRENFNKLVDFISNYTKAINKLFINIIQPTLVRRNLKKTAAAPMKGSIYLPSMLGMRGQISGINWRLPPAHFKKGLIDCLLKTIMNYHKKLNYVQQLNLDCVSNR